LTAYNKATGKVPNNLQELVSKGYLKGLPAPPPGKKLVYDPIVMTVYWGNQ
jgi:hypothetical protein